ncbi:MAG: glycerol-3-phosphate dehydrogenase/oxidase [Candidatus Omnitrophica bacterium]|nr:glycerol-3-phosphate dehydrogenase/oxidase [Candidatus Omnitrophota bacterium]
MKRDIQSLSLRELDLLVVGGGILGAGITWDASLRGLSCALVEQGDFASGTSSKTSKLIHGGIRYLESLDFGLVRDALRERGTLLQIAPHRVRPLPFLIPVAGRYPRPWLLVRLGVALYGWMAGGAGRNRVFTGKRLEQEEPFLSGGSYRRAAGYSDGQMEDAGMVLDVVRSAAASGAGVANYASVVQWVRERGAVAGAVVSDLLTGERHELRARVIVCAAGPWVDRLRRMADPGCKPILRPSKGVHLLYPDLGLRHALVVSSRKDGRILFLIPWRGMTLIGTTDTDYAGDPGRVRPEAEDVEYLIRETNAALPKAGITRERVIAAFAGVRPLAAEERRDPWAVSRVHKIHVDGNGLISIAGGKFTTFRKIAEEVVDKVAKRFPDRKIGPCTTAITSLDPDPAKKETLASWIKADARLGEKICAHHPATWADARYAVEQEMARSVSDLFWRRLPVGWSPCRGLDSLDEAARRLGEWLSWDAAERTRQADLYRQEVENASPGDTSL